MKKYLIKRDIKYRKNLIKVESKSNLFKYFLTNALVPPILKLEAKRQINQFKPKMFKTRIHNRCIISGRSGSVYRFFKLSRINLRQQASSAKITGIKKST